MPKDDKLTAECKLLKEIAAVACTTWPACMCEIPRSFPVPSKGYRCFNCRARDIVGVPTSERTPT